MTTLSYSGLSLFSECPERFKREKLSNLILEREATQFTVRGTIIHKFMEDIINIQIESGEWPDTYTAIDHMENLWNDGFDENGKNILDTCTWQNDFIEKSMEDSVSLVPIMYDELFPFLTNPIATEKHIEHPIDDKYMLHGYIDYIGEPNTIIDWKTKTSPMNTRWLEQDLQATVYAALSGWDKVNVHFVQFIYLKTKAPRIEWGSTTRDRRHTDWLLNEMIPPVIRSLEADITPPTPGWWCTNCPLPCDALPNVSVNVESLSYV